MKRILSSWHKDKIKTVTEIPSGVKPAKKDTSATYDMDAFLKKLNSEE
jgi:hypothetical protein